jgi:hypothetical protein
MRGWCHHCQAERDIQRSAIVMESSLRTQSNTTQTISTRREWSSRRGLLSRSSSSSTSTRSLSTSVSDQHLHTQEYPEFECLSCHRIVGGVRLLSLKTSARPLTNLLQARDSLTSAPRWSGGMLGAAHSWVTRALCFRHDLVWDQHIHVYLDHSSAIDGVRTVLATHTISLPAARCTLCARRFAPSIRVADFRRMCLQSGGSLALVDAVLGEGAALARMLESGLQDEE